MEYSDPAGSFEYGGGHSASGGGHPGYEPYAALLSYCTGDCCACRYLLYDPGDPQGRAGAPGQDQYRLYHTGYCRLGSGCAELLFFFPGI